MFFRRKKQSNIERWNQDRLLFRYWNGTKIVAIDPFRVYREVVSEKTIDFDTIGPMVEKWEEPATTLLIDLICRVFGVQRYDSETEKGLTDPELLNLFADLNDYLDYVKKKCNLGPISQPSTA